MKRTLWIVGGGLEAVPGIRLAREMGLHVVVSDASRNAPGLALADDRVLASTYDAAATVEAACRYQTIIRPIDGVMCIATDVPLTVARVAEALRLPGIPVASAVLASDKIAMKRQFAADGVPIPWFLEIGSVAELRTITAERPRPLVIKPVDSRGARGVLRLTEEVDLDWAFNEALGHSPSGRVMVEQFLCGPQVSTESIVLEYVAHTPGFSDRNYEHLERFAPHIIEDGGDLPSDLNESIQRDVHDLVTEAARSMGIRNGVVKGDIVIHHDEPYVIELAARLSGGYFCTHEIPLNTGVELVRHAIRLALGEMPSPADLAPRFMRPVAQRYLFPQPGRVTRINGQAEVAARAGIELCEVRVRVGDVIPATDSHPARAGVVIATGETREEAIQRAAAAVASIAIETQPVEQTGSQVMRSAV